MENTVEFVCISATSRAFLEEEHSIDEYTCFVPAASSVIVECSPDLCDHEGSQYHRFYLLICSSERS